jgi:hypothetical protein
MVAPIERLTLDQFATLAVAAKGSLTRRITAVHLHHTWRPRRTDFRGRTTVEAMRRFHMVDNGWSDIAQHLTIDPQGGLWTGRNWNAPPASQTGRNGTRSDGPFMIEMVGDFDAHAETLDGAQLEAVLQVCARLLSTFDLQTGDIHFHRELGSPKTCPGSGVDKAALVAGVAQAVSTLPALAPAAPPAGGRGTRARAARAPFRTDAVMGAAVTQPWTGGADDASPPENVRAADAIERLSGLTVAGPGAVTREIDEWAMLRPHVINLTKGLLSRTGSFKMLPGALDGIIDAIRDYALATEAPKVMLHAHGGLVGERSALEYARTAVPWWKDQGIYPVYFVWETSAFEVIKQRLGIRAEVVDRVFEAIARKAAAWAWGDMKESARLASSPDAEDGEAGGAFTFAGMLAALVASRPGGRDIALNAVGHSAGAIFQAHLLPVLASRGAPIDSLAVLAPAVRNDLFTSHLLPLAQAGTIARVLMCTMTEEAEREDDLIEPAGIPLYGKSLLYLVSRAFEPKRKTPILGLQETLLQDAVLNAYFSGGGGRLELSPSAGNPPNPNCTARRHGCFDNDTPTMRTVAGLVRNDGTVPAAPFPGDDCGERARGRRRQLAMAALGAGASGRDGTAAGPSPTPIAAGRKRALCVGIDRYTTNPLAGCVRDAGTWSTALRSLGFGVTTLLDGQATRAGILNALTDLVTTASPGDVLVFQYAGHGTQVPDDDGDEADRFDEAFVPIDVDSGALLLDDDLAEVYARLPRGAVLTLFMDCCHSGTNSRFAPRAAATATGRERRRYLPLSPWLEQAHRLFRSRMAPTGRAANAATESLDGIVHVAACQDNQYAYELDGAGNFTRIAAAALVEAVNRGDTNEAYVSRIAGAVEALGNPQTPGLMKLAPGLTSVALLGGGAAAGGRPAVFDYSGTGSDAGGDGSLVYHLTEALRLAGGQ